MSPLEVVVTNSHIGHFSVDLLEKEFLVFFQKAQVIHFINILFDNLVQLHRKWHLIEIWIDFLTGQTILFDKVHRVHFGHIEIVAVIGHKS